MPPEDMLAFAPLIFLAEEARKALARRRAAHPELAPESGGPPLWGAFGTVRWLTDDVEWDREGGGSWHG
jgi:hypothetical protein